GVRRPARPPGPAGEHRRAAAAAERPATAAVLTASDTRGRDDDPSGDLLADGLLAAGVNVRLRSWVLDERGALEAALRAALAADVDVVLVTGGTGPAPRDATPEAVRAVCGRELPGFGELFRMLSYLEIGPAAVLSRALCALHGRQVVYALPGSSAACALALERLILPELDHLRAQLSRPDRLPPERNA
ncbi:MAG: molybdenum cofactor biosynthesis protein B, partial [Candidatus Eisenbacteria bacterium]